MTNAQYTPGPWYVGLEDEYADGIPGIEIMFGKCPSPECELIAYVSGNGDDLELTDRDRANAHLIAAAPELLEACQCLPLGILDHEDNIDAAEFVDNCAEFMIAMRKARAAITKATGREA